MDILIKKAGRSINVDPTRFNEEVRDHLFAYGVRQKLNDSISSLSLTGSASTTIATADEMYANVEQTLARLYAGDVKAGRVAQPKTAEGLARREAYETVLNAWLRKTDDNGKLVNKDRKISEFTNRQELADGYYEKHKDRLLERAQEALDMAADVEV